MLVRAVVWETSIRSPNSRRALEPIHFVVSDSECGTIFFFEIPSGVVAAGHADADALSSPGRQLSPRTQSVQDSHPAVQCSDSLGTPEFMRIGRLQDVHPRANSVSPSADDCCRTATKAECSLRLLTSHVERILLDASPFLAAADKVAW